MRPRVDCATPESSVPNDLGPNAGPDQTQISDVSFQKNATSPLYAHQQAEMSRLLRRDRSSPMEGHECSRDDGHDDTSGDAVMSRPSSKAYDLTCALPLLLSL